MPQPVTTIPSSNPKHTGAGKLANMDPKPILDQLLNGSSLRQIAADIGVSNVGLRAWLLREDREQYHEAITAALAQRVAESDVALDAADDAISIARARETARFARMDFERRRPTLYGQRQQITHEIGADLSAALERAHQRISVARQQQIGPVTIDNQSGTVADSE
jgi:hypothetical protein